jgi:hypothetical protein
MAARSVDDNARRLQSGGGVSARRFFLVCFFAAAVAVILGLFFINSLFDETRRFNPPELVKGLAGFDRKRFVQPPAARNQLRVYFTSDGEGLAPALQPVKEGLSAHERGRLALEALFRGPTNEFFHSPVPEHTRLRAFYLRESEERDEVEAVVDVSRDVARGVLGGIGAEMLCAFAIVNTALANCEEADSARLLIEGRPAGLLWSHVDLSGPLPPGAMISP